MPYHLLCPENRKQPLLFSRPPPTCPVVTLLPSFSCVMLERASAEFKHDGGRSSHSLLPQPCPRGRKARFTPLCSCHVRDILIFQWVHFPTYVAKSKKPSSNERDQHKERLFLDWTCAWANVERRGESPISDREKGKKPYSPDN